jgi:hypothetical protein
VWQGGNGRYLSVRYLALLCTKTLIQLRANGERKTMDCNSHVPKQTLFKPGPNHWFWPALSSPAVEGSLYSVLAYAWGRPTIQEISQSVHWPDALHTGITNGTRRFEPLKTKCSWCEDGSYSVIQRRYKPESCGFFSHLVTGISLLLNASGRNMAVG